MARFADVVWAAGRVLWTTWHDGGAPVLCSFLFRAGQAGCIQEGQLHLGVGTHARLVHVKDRSSGLARYDHLRMHA